MTELLTDDDRSFGIINVSSQQLPITENVNSASAVDGFLPDSNDDWHSCFENPMGEVSFAFFFW